VSVFTDPAVAEAFTEGMLCSGIFCYGLGLLTGLLFAPLRQQRKRRTARKH
jgi:uncharacterized membrane protein